ncbi:type II toxin-antitoxin system VapC family toxin [Candidatus Poriferisodalis sp.]|uniref:type II toxin-antitoxin system VapC family toxin n=1 Tax=Candidatus Poriferisodalis sp. TaxID=3101277 RepID=UPI003B0104EB
MALSRGLADTSVFVAGEAGRPIRTEHFPEELAVSIITVGELRAGVLAATDTRVRDRRLSTLAAALALQPIPIDNSVAVRWAMLRVLLREEGLRMPVNDSWIAATAMALEVPVVTQDADFPSIDGLQVIRA